MKIGGSVNEFEYIYSIEKINGNDEDELIIYGAVSDASEDLDGECVDQSSLRKAWNQYLKNPVVRLMHSSEIGAIGRVIPKFKGSDGTVHKTEIKNGVPYIVAKISQASDLESVRTKIREGVYSGLSIGGKARTVRKNGKNKLMIKSLFEVSVVDIPSNQNSLFTVIKRACEGDNCKVGLNQEVNETMEDEITQFIEKKFSEMVTANEQKSEFEALQKKYDDLKASQVEITVETAVEEPVEKSLADQVADLTAQIAEMKVTPVQKGVQDGEVVVEKSSTDITSMIMSRHYGGA